MLTLKDQLKAQIPHHRQEINEAVFLLIDLFKCSYNPGVAKGRLSVNSAENITDKLGSNSNANSVCILH